jgi:peptidoglycan/xylan/chitin deacetylase (PgdA/CDA1 family)
MGKVTLTIDNGPHPDVTPEVLQVLADKNVPAHFFVVGAQVSKPGGRDLLERIAKAGHTIGNHTWSHTVRFGENAAATAIQDEVARTAELIAPYVGSPPLFRPVGGGGRLDSNLFSRELIDYLCTAQYTCALWNVVPRDWEDLEGWANRAIAEIKLHPWSVVVVHDVIRRNAAQIDTFIDRARDAGHEFVREISPECLPIVAGEVTQDLSTFTSVGG